MRAALTMSAATCYEDRLGQRSVEGVVGEMAWVEARELLARVEPQDDCHENVPLSVVKDTTRQVAWRPLHWSHEYADALADALRAFIGEDPCDAE